MTKATICTLFGCTEQQLQNQYKHNADTLTAMRDKASKTGKKVGNYTAEQLTERAAKYSELSK